MGRLYIWSLQSKLINWRLTCTGPQAAYYASTVEQLRLSRVIVHTPDALHVDIGEKHRAGFHQFNGDVTAPNGTDNC